MNIWESTVLTDKGKELQAKLMNGVPLQIVKVKTGGAKIPVVNLRQQTDVTPGGSDITLQPGKIEGDKTVIPVLLENTTLAESYDLWQIGLYAQDPDEGVILYCLAQASQAKHIPSSTENPGYSISWDFCFQTSDMAPFEVSLRANGLVNIEQYQIHSDEIGKANARIDSINTELIDAKNEIKNRYTKTELNSMLGLKMNSNSIVQHYIDSGDKSLATSAENTIFATFIVPSTGSYIINANAYFALNNKGTYRQLDILKNGISQGVMSNIPLASPGTRVINEKILLCNKGDVITFILRQNSGTSLNCSMFANILGIYK